MAPSSSSSPRPPSPSASQPGHLPSNTIQPRHRRLVSTASASATTNGHRVNEPASSTTFPFTFIRPYEPKQSSTSLAPSTAQGKAIPVDDSTAENRTSALRELNHTYPSRHRYERSTGAQSSTYSEPVIVRSYYAPGHSRPTTSRGSVVIHGGAGAASTAGSSASRRSVIPFTATVTPAGSGMLSRMARARDRKRTEAAEEAKLPPVEAFTFKSFMANMDMQDGSADDINADLDRIAEICARSRYSLSNQYEVHYQPHGSGATFLGPGTNQEHNGPTLQIITSDDERTIRRQRRRRTGPRRNSRAIGTLETIISSSRSSEEDRSKKRSAAELADEVRGRAMTKESGKSTPSTSPQSPSDKADPQEEQQVPTTRPTPIRRKSLALIDNSKQEAPAGQSTTPHGSSTGLIGEPSLPQASTSQLEIRTGPEVPNKERKNNKPRVVPTPAPPELPMARGCLSSMDQNVSGTGLFSAIAGWMPWRSVDAERRSGRAEGSLRQLLRAADVKGKGTET
ncbi:hypothetical protein N3K66_006786 [Trichothecium roseum]|uniref:Uncharacterized protein n=1 Tax=Trichothecium roseum TaxID=47278 RepID=A0ACC0UXK1_9HYPO|nr:hypothetical protein N3K66_006786 [Trichothecium roseum]